MTFVVKDIERAVRFVCGGLSAEEMMSGLYTLFKYKGVPIKAHWSLLCALPIFYLLSGSVVQQRNVIGALIGFVSYAILILIHEAGHAVIAMRRGMDVLGIYLYPLHGRCDHQASEYEVDEIWIAWGGIIAQALLFVTVFFIAGILGAYSGGLRLLLEPMLMVFISLNALMIITNLMPMTSLDGDTAWRVLPRFWYNFVIPSLRHHVARLKRRKTTKKISEQDASLIAEDVLKKIMGKEQR